MEQRGGFRGLERASPYLCSHAKARLAAEYNERKGDLKLDVGRVLEKACLSGGKGYADAAETPLEEHGGPRCAGESDPDAQPLPGSTRESGYTGTEVKVVRTSKVWKLLGYKDLLQLKGTLLDALGLTPEEPGTRQCLCLHVTAAPPMLENGSHSPREIDAVSKLAETLRSRREAQAPECICRTAHLLVMVRAFGAAKLFR